MGDAAVRGLGAEGPHELPNCTIQLAKPNSPGVGTSNGVYSTRRNEE